MLREIIDDAEHLPGLFVAVLADAALATGDPRRALSQYAALQMRVWPDVRPGDRQNPVAPLVWLAAMMTRGAHGDRGAAGRRAEPCRDPADGHRADRHRARFRGGIGSGLGRWRAHHAPGSA